MRRLALLSGAAAAVLVVLLFRDGLPSGGEETVETAVALVLALAPPVILLVFWLALRELLELPARLRNLPETGREHREELGRLAHRARSEGGSWRSPRLLLRFGLLLGSARESLTPWAPLLPLLSVPFLLLTVAAALGAVLEVLIVLAMLANAVL